MTLGQRASHIIKTKTGPDDPELLETLQEALTRANAGDLIAVADELAERHARFSACLGEANAIQSLTQQDLDWIARSVTASHRQAATLAEYLAQHNITVVTHELLHGDNQAAVRVAGFVARLHDLDHRLRLELATSLLHYTFPEDHWLWTRWMWDTTTHTGILPLLAGSVHNLAGRRRGRGVCQGGTCHGYEHAFRRKAPACSRRN